MPEHKSWYRVVVQRAGTDFALIAYGPGPALRPLTFSSLDNLLLRLQSVMPDAQRQLLTSGPAVETQVIFSGNIEMGDTELQALGFRPPH